MLLALKHKGGKLNARSNFPTTNIEIKKASFLGKSGYDQGRLVLKANHRWEDGWVALSTTKSTFPSDFLSLSKRELQISQDVAMSLA